MHQVGDQPKLQTYMLDLLQLLSFRRYNLSSLSQQQCRNDGNDDDDDDDDDDNNNNNNNSDLASFGHYQCKVGLGYKYLHFCSLFCEHTPNLGLTYSLLLFGLIVWSVTSYLKWEVEADFEI